MIHINLVVGNPKFNFFFFCDGYHQLSHHKKNINQALDGPRIDTYIIVPWLVRH